MCQYSEINILNGKKRRSAVKPTRFATIIFIQLYYVEMLIKTLALDAAEVLKGKGEFCNPKKYEMKSSIFITDLTHYDVIVI